ncbi:MAG: DUF2877 domain-containing protein [Calditrichaeota bacterium]|nr:DUF2877 domain-containing protein [Calditrichota bacterium]
MLLSIGDCLPSGEFPVHSCFTKAINFVHNGDIVSLVQPVVGAGPANIVLHEDAWRNYRTLRVSDDAVQLDGIRMSIDESIRYDSALRLQILDDRSFTANLAILEQEMFAAAPAESMVFLLEPRFRQKARSGFAKALAERFLAAAALIRENDFAGSIPLLRGAGPGLTPAGDDFIAGMLLALQVERQCRGEIPAALIERMYRGALGENLLSNTYLNFARAGRVFAPMKNLLNALSGDAPAEIRRHAGVLLARGATSGADLASGFCLTLRQFWKGNQDVDSRKGA